MDRHRQTRLQGLGHTIALTIAMIACAVLVACGGSSQTVQIAGRTMGTTLMIRFSQPEPALDNDWALDHIDVLLQDINARMSIYDPDSELSRFNASRETTPFPVSSDTLRVLQIAHQVSVLSDGAFDVTIGPLVNAYGFGPEPFDYQMPPQATIAALHEYVGYQMVEIDADQGTIRKHHPQVVCDLGGVAKGYGVDVVALWLESQGVTDYMVEIGGEVRTRGRYPSGRLWRIGIERPDAHSGVVHRVIHLCDMAVATSGDYRNYMEVDGQRISHTIDPRSGLPVRHNLASVTVLRPTCAEADAWATALTVLGIEEGLELAEQEGIAALFLTRLPDGKFSEKTTTAFEEYEKGLE